MRVVDKRHGRCCPVCVQVEPCALQQRPHNPPQRPRLLVSRPESDPRSRFLHGRVCLLCCSQPRPSATALVHASLSLSPTRATACADAPFVVTLSRALLVSNSHNQCAQLLYTVILSHTPSKPFHGGRVNVLFYKQILQANRISLQVVASTSVSSSSTSTADSPVLTSTTSPFQQASISQLVENF